MLERNKLYLGNSLELMQELDDGSVDFLFTDPPYNISLEKSNFHTLSGGLGGRWAMQYGQAGGWGDKNFDIVGWLDIAIPKLKEGGNLVIFNDWKNMGLIADKLTELKCIQDQHQEPYP